MGQKEDTIGRKDSKRGCRPRNAKKIWYFFYCGATHCSLLVQISCCSSKMLLHNSVYLYFSSHRLVVQLLAFPARNPGFFILRKVLLSFLFFTVRCFGDNVLVDLNRIYDQCQWHHIRSGYRTNSSATALLFYSAFSIRRSAGKNYLLQRNKTQS